MAENTNKNTDRQTWFGRCIFLSWYCDLGTCTFCFRSTQKHKIKHAKNARRSIASILTDAIIGKNLGWRIEFLTGGYRIFSFNETLDIIKKVSGVYGEKIWINLGTMSREQLEQIRPYVEGVCASIETVNPELHNEVCPDKPVGPYEEFLELAGSMGFRKSITIVIGLGETKKDFEMLADFIRKHSLDRITFYALKPVKGTPFTQSPDPDYYSWWIRKTRDAFPEIEIMAGLTPKRPDYTKDVLEAGATAVTKFPVVKKFGSDDARLIEKQAMEAGREFIGSLTDLPDIDWHAEAEKLDVDDELKESVKRKLDDYLKMMVRASQGDKGK
ncbi:MAG: radical SAM protein [Candidatus Woesearchaeota archaeon]